MEEEESGRATGQRRARQITQISLRNLWQPVESSKQAASSRPALLSRPSKRRARRSSDPPALKRTTSKASIRSLDSKVTTRERASSSVLFINARAHQRRPRSTSQHSEQPAADKKGKGKLELHAPRNEHAANAERWSREAMLRSTMLNCHCIVSDSKRVGYASEELGPAMDFDWQIPAGSLKSPEGEIKVDVWALRSAGDDWSLIRTWTIRLDDLVSLGQKPAAFPVLPSNTIILQLEGEEYFTTSHILPDTPSLSDAEEADEDEGTLSDPGPSQSSIKSKRKTRFLKAVEQGRKDQEEMLERSRRETRMLVCESLEQMMGILEASENLASGKWEIEKSREALDNRMKKGLGGLHREVRQMWHAVSTGKDQTSSAQDQISHVKKAIEQRQSHLSQRRGRLKDGHALLDTLWSDLHDQKSDTRRQEKKLATLQQYTAQTQAGIASTLDFIFSILPSVKHHDSMTFSILGLDLPNSVFPPKSDDDLVSSALGLVAQLLNMLAAYLGVPLHYALTCAGSRSCVTDLISMIKGPRVFPLYSSGVERYRFEYAVFLLNKDIEQVMQFQKIAMPDLKDTLPNIKNLMLTVISRPTTAHLPNGLNGPPDLSTSNGLMLHLEDALGDHSDEEASPTSSKSNSPAPTLRASVRSRSSTTTVKINADKLASSVNTSGILHTV